MKRLKKIKVIPELPEKISGLKELIYNLWWSWSTEAVALFEYIDKDLYNRLNNNPVKLIAEVSQERLEELVQDKTFMDMYEAVIKEFKTYMDQDDTWFNKYHGAHKDKKIAYFCAEFGVHECVPIYSGGLGVLAGDHSKSASDLDLPFVGIGLLYRQGYFDQEIDYEGRQKNTFHSHDFSDMPLHRVTDENGDDVVISVEIHNRKLYARAWEMKVGRVSLYLMDADIPQNSDQDREITYKLYGGDQDMRISQEILLGMGGVKLLRKLGFSPSVWHMNEGHSVFMGLERIKEMVHQDGLSFYEALENVRSNTLFTTHTPVPAGNDAFPLSLKDKYFKKYWESVGLSRQQFMDLGIQIMPEGYELFSLTILALRLSGKHNGVSKLHGDVSSDLWKDVWKDIPKFENPITYVTNGVHTLSWMAPEMKSLLKKYIGKNWMYFLSKDETWKDIDNIPDKELWETHIELKKQFIEFSRDVMKNQYKRNRISAKEIGALNTVMSENALVIGFARRFATYKRATLLFRDIERLKAILNIPDMEVHFVFAGKAHPADKGGQALIMNIHEIAKQEGFKGKVFFLENYSLHVSRYMVRGVDVWLNNPKRPLEASGTSGQKVPVNGGLNFSILDGWWDEGYYDNNGWAINPEIQTVEDDMEQAIIDSISLYDVLEKDIIPMFYDRDENGLPLKWIQYMKNSMRTVIPEFSMDRMVENYTNQLYIPLLESGLKYSEDAYSITKKTAHDRYMILSGWRRLFVEKSSGIDNLDNVRPGKTYDFLLKVNRGGLLNENIKAQLCIYGMDEKPVEIIDFSQKEDGDSTEFSLSYEWKNSGDFYAGVRLVPVFDNMLHPYEPGVAYWLS